MLLTSALYFKGRWLKSFDRNATHPRCFRIARNCQNVLMMENTSKYRYGYIAYLDADVVEIPYSVRFDAYIINKLAQKDFDAFTELILKNLFSYPVMNLIFQNGRTSMLIFLPSHEENDPSLQILSKDLSYVPMKTLLTSLNETELVLSIPRFTIESKLDLHSSLMRVSINDIYNYI